MVDAAKLYRQSELRLVTMPVRSCQMPKTG